MVENDFPRYFPMLNMDGLFNQNQFLELMPMKGTASGGMIKKDRLQILDLHKIEILAIQLKV